MPLGMDVGVSQGDFVLDGDAVSLRNKGGLAPSQFSAHFYCAQKYYLNTAKSEVFHKVLFRFLDRISQPELNSRSIGAF